MNPFRNFDEFWPYYLSEHSKRVNRMLHFIGTTSTLTLVAASAHFSAKLLILVPIGGYAFAWIGHFAIEGNRPATFKHPLWSLRADFRMYRLMLLGKMWGD